MLTNVRVVDLSDGQSLLAGQILADLGADVVQVEPPGGATVRRAGLGRHADSAQEPVQALWLAYARNKRGITCDLHSPDGRALARNLAIDADILIESGYPGEMNEVGLGYSGLSESNPGLIYVSISPFGHDGPKSQYAATDLTLMAAGGPLAGAGDPDRAPVRVSVPQAGLHAAADAAVAALIAYLERTRSGLGQHIDVSIQASVGQATNSILLAKLLNSPETVRAAGGIVLGGYGGRGIHIRTIWPAKDGYVSLAFLFGSAMGPFTQRLLEWMWEEGGCDEAIRDKDWIGYATLLATGAEPIDEYERIKGVVEAFLRTKTKAELLDVAIQRRLLISPISTIPEVLENPQFRERGFWTGASSASPKPVYPGPFALARPPLVSYERPAPSPGEHTDEVTSELGARPPRGGRPAAAREVQSAALAGLRVVDLTWAIAGPSCTRVLADYGATVVKIESTRRVDTARTLAPFYNGTPGPESSGLFQNYNAGKLGMTLNLAGEQGKSVFRDLARWADVVIESFSPGVMTGWGLSYDSLRDHNPGLIMLSTCLFGQTGPLATLAGYGNMGSAISGFTNLAGYLDRDPAGPYGAYSDYVAPRYMLVSLLAAIDRQRRTGEGCYIDHSQVDSTIHFLTPALLEFQLSGESARLDGNRDADMCPHGVYPCSGSDSWVAIAIRSDAEFGALKSAVHSLRDVLGLDTVIGRMAQETLIDRIIGEWTSTRTNTEVERVLQAARVPAHAVQGSALVTEDQQLAHRGWFATLPHPVLGEAVIEASRFRLSRTPAAYARHAPTLGLDNDHILREILQYDDATIQRLAEAGALD